MNHFTRRAVSFPLHIEFATDQSRLYFQAAERDLIAECGDSMDTWIVARKPVGVYSPSATVNGSAAQAGRDNILTLTGDLTIYAFRRVSSSTRRIFWRDKYGPMGATSLTSHGLQKRKLSLE